MLFFIRFCNFVCKFWRSDRQTDTVWTCSLTANQPFSSFSILHSPWALCPCKNLSWIKEEITVENKHEKGITIKLLTVLASKHGGEFPIVQMLVCLIIFLKNYDSFSIFKMCVKPCHHNICLFFQTLQRHFTDKASAREKTGHS